MQPCPTQIPFRPLVIGGSASWLYVGRVRSRAAAILPCRAAAQLHTALRRLSTGPAATGAGVRWTLQRSCIPDIATLQLVSVAAWMSISDFFPASETAGILPAKLDDSEGAGSGRQRNLQERTPAAGVVVRESARLNARAHPAQHSMIPGDLGVRSKQLGTKCE